MNRYQPTLLLLLSLALCACGSSSTASSSSATDTVEPPSEDSLSPDPTDSEATPVDTGSAEDSSAAEDTEPPTPEPDVPDVPAAPPFDFAAQAPWYSCTGESLPPEVTEVTALDQEYQYFGAENRRKIELEVDFPESGTWAQVGLVYHLECPENGKCDHWDRAASLQLLVNPDAESAKDKYLEITRPITPYRVEMCQYIDVTPLAPLLRGKQTIASWIDTWVGPGHAQGEGWRVTARFVFYPGPPDLPSKIINVWGRRNITVGEIEADKNVDIQTTPFDFEIPAGATRVEAHLTTTGHSFGNTANCAEFCQMRHDLWVNGTMHSVNPWRADCAQNPISNQLGTWKYPRNGWCPGALSIGDRVDITQAVLPGKTNSLDLDVLLANGQEYDNVSPVDLLPYTLTSLKLYVYEDDDR